MNYKIINDEELLKDFIDNWLPELGKTEQYYLCLFARNKYTRDLDITQIAHIKSDKAQLKRFTSTKEKMLDKIKQLEIEVGRYKQKDTPIPQEALAMYITPNPRDLWKATFNSVIKLTECIRDGNVLNNPHQEVMSEIQRTRGTRHFVDFDIDETDPEVIGKSLQTIKGCVNQEALSILQTRGGVHVLVKPNLVASEYKNSWYNNISRLGVDQVGDQMIPIPGCTQGMFTPHFLKTTKNEDLLSVTVS